MPRSTLYLDPYGSFLLEDTDGISRLRVAEITLHKFVPPMTEAEKTAQPKPHIMMGVASDGTVFQYARCDAQNKKLTLPTVRHSNQMGKENTYEVGILREGNAYEFTDTVQSFSRKQPVPAIIFRERIRWVILADVFGVTPMHFSKYTPIKLLPDYIEPEKGHLALIGSLPFDAADLQKYSGRALQEKLDSYIHKWRIPRASLGSLTKRTDFLVTSVGQIFRITATAVPLGEDLEVCELIYSGIGDDDGSVEMLLHEVGQEDYLIACHPASISQSTTGLAYLTAPKVIGETEELLADVRDRDVSDILPAAATVQ